MGVIATGRGFCGPVMNVEAATDCTRIGSRFLEPFCWVSVVIFGLSNRTDVDQMLMSFIHMILLLTNVQFSPRATSVLKCLTGLLQERHGRCWDISDLRKWDKNDANEHHLYKCWLIPAWARMWESKSVLSKDYINIDGLDSYCLEDFKAEAIEVIICGLSLI